MKNTFFDDMVKFFESHAHEYEYITHDRQTIWIPLVSAEKNHIEVFYSPITNSCIGTIRASGDHRSTGD
jgi:hypothetical protein